MRVRIVSATDFNGNKKSPHIWGNERILLPYPVEVGKRMILQYVDDYLKARVTTEVKAIQEGVGNQKQYFTQNTIYTLEELGDY